MRDKCSVHQFIARSVLGVSAGMGSCVSVTSTGGTISTKRSAAETTSTRTSEETMASRRQVNGLLHGVSGDKQTVAEETFKLGRQKSSVRRIEVTPVDSTAGNSGGNHSSAATTVHVAASKGRPLEAVSHGSFGPGLVDPGNVDTRPTRRGPGPVFGAGGGDGAGSRLSGRISCSLSRCHNDHRSTAAAAEEEQENKGRETTMHRRQSLTQQWVALCLQTNTHKPQHDSAYDSMYYSNESQQLSPIDGNVKMTSFPEDAPVDFRAKSAMYDGWSSEDSSDDWTSTLKDDDSLFSPSFHIDRGVVTAVRKKARFPQSSGSQIIDRPKAAVEGRRSKPILTVR